MIGSSLNIVPPPFQVVPDTAAAASDTLAAVADSMASLDSLLKNPGRIMPAADRALEYLMDMMVAFVPMLPGEAPPED